MRIDWSPLRRELALWRAERLVLPFWWRDDDAVAVTPALDQLAAMAEDLDLPAHLAVIPAEAEAALASYIADTQHLIPVVHGWSHENHAPDGQKKAEFGQPRAGATASLAQGLTHLQQLFGPRLLPAFVAPWNRLHPAFLPDLAAAGYRIVSTHGLRAAAQAHPGLLAINSHIDPIDWRGTRGLVGPDTIIDQTVAHLQARRQRAEDNGEPLGYLTHHLVHIAEIWSFSHAYLSELQAGGARSTPLSHALKDLE